MISLHRISLKCCSIQKLCFNFFLQTSLYSTFPKQETRKALQIQIAHIPSRVCRLLPVVAVRIDSKAGNYRSVVTQSSADEQEAPNEFLKQILLVVEQDPSYVDETCSIYIDKLIQSSNLSNVAYLLEGLRDKQIVLSLNTYKTLLRAAAEVNDFELSSRIFKDILPSKSLDSSSFINIAKAFQQSTDLDLLQFIREVSELTFPRSATFINRIIVGFSETGQTQKVLMIFKEMGNLKCKPDTFTWNIVLAALGKAGKMDQMLSEFSSMKESDHVPDIVTYNTLINNLKKVGRMDLCSKFTCEMVERGIEPDLLTFTALIDGFGRLGNVDEALELFGEMKRKQVRPSIHVYTSLIDGLKKVGKFELAQSLSEEMNLLVTKAVIPKDFRRKKGSS